MDKLDPLNEFVSHRFYRQHCSTVIYENKEFDAKPLNRLRGNTDDIIILDNSPFSYFFYPEVGIPINNFYNDMKDSELETVADFIGSLAIMRQSDMVIAIAEYVKQKMRWSIAKKFLSFMRSLCGNQLKEHDI